MKENCILRGTAKAVLMGLLLCTAGAATAQSGNISFADANVKTICVASATGWDTNNDGELSYAEAAAVASLGTVFKDKTTITSFNELQHFTGLTEIPSNAFFGCTALTLIAIPNSVKSILARAFYGCNSLTSIAIPSSVTFVVSNAFSDCSSLAQITVASGNTVYDSRNNCNAIIRKSDNTLVAGCKNTIIPNTVVSIGDNAFNGCKDLESIAIPSSVTSIGEFAFSHCSGLTSIVIPNSVTQIGQVAFGECTNLVSAVLPNSSVTVGTHVFQLCSNLTSIVIPDSWETIPRSMFLRCESLATVVIGRSVKSIEYNAFNRCNVTSIIVKAPTPPICGERNFINQNPNVVVSNVSIPEGSGALYQNDSYWSGFTSATFVETDFSIDPIYFADQTVKNICVQKWGSNGELTYGQAAAVTDLGLVFGNKSITSFNELRYFTGLTTIGQQAFYGCSNLKSITIPKNVTSILENFSWCGSLESITVDEDNTVFDSRNNCNAIIRTADNTLVVGCKTTVIPNTVVAIGDQAFSQRVGLTSIIIPTSVTHIGNSSFYITGLTSIDIPSSVISIGTNSFSSCRYLNQITVASGNTVYDSRNNCNAIIRKADNTLVVGCKSTVIPNTVVAIGDQAFSGCQDLTSITIPSSVTSIGASAFYDCYALTSIVIPNSVTSIGEKAFNVANTGTGLQSVTIGSSVNFIGNYAFYNCDLTSITLNAVTPPVCGTGVFKNGILATTPVYVPCSSVEAYQGASPWNTFSKIWCVVELQIDGYTGDADGWQLIASPMDGEVSPEDVEGMLSNTYDLYKFDGSVDGAQWQNYKNHNGDPGTQDDHFTMLEAGKGYLYANSADVVLRFTGEPTGSSYPPVSLEYDDTSILGSWNLIGNRYMTEATVSRSDFYRLITQNGISTLVLNDPNNFVVNAMEGIFVQATAAGDEVTFTKSTRGASAVASPTVNIDLRNAEGRLLDRARLRMDEGANMGKLDLMSDPNRLYFRDGGKDYAVVYAAAQGEMPLSFDAAQNGSFTLNVSVEGMEMEYLHLIDNMTGADIDLLATSTGSVANYTFTGKPGDYASRFRLVFSANGVNDNQEDNNANFAYINGEEIVILNAEANATLQVVDITGRIIVSRDGVHTVSTAGMVPGVYVLRLINGTDVKVQKIVIE